jgi:molybdopterin/thiamine biosynthesis adenylyltransferase
MLGYDPIILLNSYLGVYPDDLPSDLLEAFKRKKLKMAPEFTFPMHCQQTPTCIIMVGCGGTGSELLPKILQYLVAREKTFKIPVVPILLIDGDLVEEKNVSRQRFTASDVGKNKAEALAERYSDVFSVEISSYPDYVTPANFPKVVDNLCTGINNVSNFCPLFIGAIDNNRARLAILSAYLKYSNAIWIDAGNEDHYGQAILSMENLNIPAFTYTTDPTRDHHIKAASYKEMTFEMPQCIPTSLPNFFDLYPEQFLKIPKDPETPAGVCAQNVVENPQTIQANAYSANAAFILFSQVIEKKILSSSIYFDSLGGGAKPEPISFDSLQKGHAKIKQSRKFLKGFFQGLCFGPKDKKLSVDGQTSQLFGFYLSDYENKLSHL